MDKDVLYEKIIMLIQDSENRITIEVPNMNLDTEDRVKLMDFIHIIEMSSIPLLFKYFKIPGILRMNLNKFNVTLDDSSKVDYNLLFSTTSIYKEIWLLFIKYINDEIDMDSLTSNIFPIVDNIYNNINIEIKVNTNAGDPTVDLEFCANGQMVANVLDVSNTFLKSFEIFTDKLNLFQLIKIIDKKLNSTNTLLGHQRRSLSFANFQQEYVELLSLINETKDLSNE